MQGEHLTREGGRRLLFAALFHGLSFRNAPIVIVIPLISHCSLDGVQVVVAAGRSEWVKGFFPGFLLVFLLLLLLYTLGLRRRLILHNNEVRGCKLPQLYINLNIR